uniref:Uncharacterized protein n=1 Tax=Oryza punctata TaxID=4537 RepID=A0A0E0M5C9_ORYPU
MEYSKVYSIRGRGCDFDFMPSATVTDAVHCLMGDTSRRRASTSKGWCPSTPSVRAIAERRSAKLTTTPASNDCHAVLYHIGFACGESV